MPHKGTECYNTYLCHEKSSAICTLMMITWHETYYEKLLFSMHLVLTKREGIKRGPKKSTYCSLNISQ